MVFPTSIAVAARSLWPRKKKKQEEQKFELKLIVY